MKRRDFLIQSCLGASAASLLPTTTLWGSTMPAYTGRLFVMVHAAGGWDPTCFCDPKMNVPGRPVINHWAENDVTRQVGNIRYAPFASNEYFFEKYYRDMLVINGIDAQTNSHSTGVLHNWSGRLSVGYPALPALLAAIYAPDMPMAWINNGGYPETSNLIRFTRMNDPFLVKNIAYPNLAVWDGNPFIIDEEWSAMQQVQQTRLDDLRNSTNLLPWQQKQREIYYQSRDNAESLQAFADLVPSEDELEPAGENNRDSSLKRQAQLALLAFQSGVAMTADMYYRAFDTHNNHDSRHGDAMSQLTDGIDYLWEYAASLGLSDRLTVMISSDFGRTPRYNGDDGKDHWPIGSALIMQKDAPWGNRTIGVTDDGHNAISINPDTLQPDSENGTLIYPRHVLTAFRKLAGIDTHPITRKFQFFENAEFDMLNPGIQTPQI